MLIQKSYKGKTLNKSSLSNLLICTLRRTKIVQNRLIMPIIDGGKNENELETINSEFYKILKTLFNYAFNSNLPNI